MFILFMVWICCCCFYCLVTVLDGFVFGIIVGFLGSTGLVVIGGLGLGWGWGLGLVFRFRIWFKFFSILGN